VPVGISLDDGHERSALAHQYAKVMPEVFPVYVNKA
jgi:hypothetical protein